MNHDIIATAGRFEGVCVNVARIGKCPPILVLGEVLQALDFDHPTLHAEVGRDRDTVPCDLADLLRIGGAVVNVGDAMHADRAKRFLRWVAKLVGITPAEMEAAHRAAVARVNLASGST